MARWSAPSASSSCPWSRDRSSGQQADRHPYHKTAVVTDEWAQWHCGHCASPNWCNYGSQKKRCRACGINKSFRNAVAPAAPATPASWRSPSASEHQWSASATPFVPAGMTDQTAKDFIAGIKELEALYASVPDDPALIDVKSGIANRIADLKHKLAMTKPIGARLDSSRAFVARCQSRRESALAELSAARSTAEEAEVALAEALSFLTNLEAEMAPPEPASQRLDSLETMAASLTRVISEMKDTCSIPPDLILETERHMRHLMDGVRVIAETSSQPAAQVPPLAPTPAGSAALKATAPRSRPQPFRSMRARINGKQCAIPVPRRTKITVKSSPKTIFAPPMNIDSMPVDARGDVRPAGSAAPGQPGL